jgi:hypothetical protein
VERVKTSWRLPDPAGKLRARLGPKPGILVSGPYTYLAVQIFLKYLILEVT